MRPFRLLTRTTRFRFSKISTESLKALRDFSGAPLMKCKEALEKFSDIEQAKAYLREKNLMFAEKKEKNECNEGVLSAVVLQNGLLVVTVNSETDFVSKNDDFLHFVGQASTVLAGNFDQLPTGITEVTTEHLENFRGFGQGEASLLESQKLITARIQEKIKIARVFKKGTHPNQVIGTYLHKEVRPGVSGSLAYVVLETSGPASPAALTQLAEDLAILVFCKQCKYLSLDDIPKEEVEKVRAGIEEAEKSVLASKPEEVRKKIISGKLMKHYGDDLLLEQTADFADNETKLADYLKGVEKQLGVKIHIKEFGTHSVN